MDWWGAGREVMLMEVEVVVKVMGGGGGRPGGAREGGRGRQRERAGSVEERR